MEQIRSNYFSRAVGNDCSTLLTYSGPHTSSCLVSTPCLSGQQMWCVCGVCVWVCVYLGRGVWVKYTHLSYSPLVPSFLNLLISSPSPIWADNTLWLKPQCLINAGLTPERSHHYTIRIITPCPPHNQHHQHAPLPTLTLIPIQILSPCPQVHSRWWELCVCVFYCIERWYLL